MSEKPIAMQHDAYLRIDADGKITMMGWWVPETPGGTSHREAVLRLVHWALDRADRPPAIEGVQGMSEEKRCDQCQHWDRDNAEKAHTPGMPDVRKCNKAAMFWDVIELDDYSEHGVKEHVVMPGHKDDQMFVQDGGDYHAILLTRPGFYCASFVEVPRPPTTNGV